MAIKKNFKVISEDKDEFKKEQVNISLSDEEKEKVGSALENFFSSVKTLLREGAVLIDNAENAEILEESLEESFLENPSLKNENLKLHILALKVLPKEKYEKILNEIEGIKMSEDFDFLIQSSQNLDAVNFIAEKISGNLKEYSKELPVIMQERAEKIKILIGVSPEVKKYLENKK